MTVTVTLCIWFRLLILVLSPSLLLSLSGDIEGAVETLENVYTQKGDTSRDVSISFVFRKVIEQKNDQALDKCKTHTHTHSSTHTHTCGSSLYMLSFLFWVSWKPSDWRPSLSLVAAMAERLANHFASYRAASDLFLQYVDSGLNEEAKFLLMVSPSALSLSLCLSHTLSAASSILGISLCYGPYQICQGSSSGWRCWPALFSDTTAVLLPITNTPLSPRREEAPGGWGNHLWVITSDGLHLEKRSRASKIPSSPLYVQYTDQEVSTPLSNSP